MPFRRASRYLDREVCLQQFTSNSSGRHNDPDTETSHSEHTAKDALLGLYAAVSAPEQYWAALKLLQGLIDDEMDQESLKQHTVGLQRMAEAELKRAGSHQATAKDGWSLTFDKSGKILTTGTDIAHSSQNILPEMIWNLPFYEDDLLRLRQYVTSEGQGAIVMIMLGEGDDTNKVAHVTASSIEGCFTMHVAHLRLPVGALETFRTNFGVTVAQFSVLEDLVAGRTIADIAMRQGRSIETIRSHVKALTQKLSARGQSDLVVRSLTVAATKSVEKSTTRQYFEVADNAMRVQFVRSGDPAGRPVLYFHQATDGPNVTRKLDEALRDAGLNMIGISRPGCGQSARLEKGRKRAFLEDSAYAMHQVVRSLGLTEARLLTVGSGLGHAFTYARLFAPNAHIVAASPFPPLTSPEICDVLPGRWRSFGILAQRQRILVKIVTLLACRLFIKKPADHVKSIIADEIKMEIAADLLEDIRATRLENGHLSAIHYARHFVGEAEAVASDWSANAHSLCPDVTIDLVQGNAHFTVPQHILGLLCKTLPNTIVRHMDEPCDPIHLLRPDILCQMLCENRR